MSPALTAVLDNTVVTARNEGQRRLGPSSARTWKESSHSLRLAADDRERAVGGG